MKRKTYLWFLILLMSIVSISTWAGSYTYDFSGVKDTKGSGLWYSNSACTSIAGCYTSTNKGTTKTSYYYKSGERFDFYAGTAYYFSVQQATATSYFLFGKSGAYIILPTYSGEKITNVTVQGSTGHSTNVSLNIKTADGSNDASTGSTWSSTGKSHSYDIKAAYQSSQLRLQVTNAYNAQITSITITTSGGCSVAPVIGSFFRTSQLT